MNKEFKMKKAKFFYGALAVCILAAVAFGAASCASPAGGSPISATGDDPNNQIVTAGGVIFALRYVPATPTGGFQRDSTADNMSIISNGYWMGETEITQGLFAAVMGGEKPSNFTTNPEDGSADGWKKLPVEQVSWYDAIAFCNKLSLLDGKTTVYNVSDISDWAGLAYAAIPTSTDPDWDAATINATATGYRLPTEMEWMWAAMGATDGGVTVTTTGYNKAFAGDNGSNALGNYAWWSSGKTHEVGRKTANELGLKDMSGNVWEWCWDWYASSIPAGEKTDFQGADSGSTRVIRGGSWYFSDAFCTVARRYYDPPHDRISNSGFRVVRAD
jgi:formylglycine-generating enzyme required for sulfatase activity